MTARPGGRTRRCAVPNLTAEDLAQHHALGIPPELLEQAGVERVTDSEARARLSSRHPGDLAGVVYPYRDPATGAPQTCRLRRDHPEVEEGKPRDKYLSAYGDVKHLFFPPNAGELLADTSALVVIVEAEKSALAIMAAAERTERRVLAIATGGCWGWRGRIGKTTDASGARVDEKGPLPDLARIAWTGRDVVVLFDANAATNQKVQAARSALAQDLLTRGTPVRIGEIQTEDGINGPDDYIGKHGDAALFALLDAARPAKRSQDQSIADLLSEFQLTAETVRDITPDELGKRLSALAEALTGADRLRRALVADALKKTSKVPATIVNAALATQASETEKKDSSTITLADDEPWPEPVNGAVLLDETAALVRRHLIMSSAQAYAIAVWTAAAYVINALALMPILLVTAPAMRSGKTTLLTLLGAIVPRALAASNLTGAVLARAFAAFSPTLLADEADTWLTDEASELCGIMNAGHTRPTAYVLRCAPDTHEPTLIPCFGARVIAMIRKPRSTITDRSIAIDLRRKRADEQVIRLRVDRLHDEHGPLRRQWRRWADDHLEALRELDPLVPAGLHDRAADNWRPLLAIADLAGGEWPARARAAAVELSGGDAAEESVSIDLLHDIRAVFKDHPSRASLSSAELTAALVAMPDRPWAEWSGGRPMTSVKLAGRLKPFGIRTWKVRDGTKSVNTYVLADFQDAWSRYPQADSEQSEQPNESGLEPQVFKSEQRIDVPSQESAISPMFTESVPTVPTSEPDSGEEITDGLI